MQCSKSSKTQKKVLILGLDGLSPDLMERWMDEGVLPNFSKLRQEGSYAHLKTINPAESPIVWTSVATGVNPGKHAVFEFVKHDPRTYRITSFSDVKKSSRKAQAFWQYTSRNKIPTYVFYCPNTMPVDKVYGKMIGGMGVPDLRGGQGIFSFYTTKDMPYKERQVGDVILVRRRGKLIITSLRGPLVSSVKGFKIKKDFASIPMYIELDGSQATITIQNNSAIVKEKEWSPWFKATFKIGMFRKAHGICKFYLKNISPDFELYCTAINFDPYNPLVPISYPNKYSAEVADKIGLYYTQGMPIDTWALVEDRIDDAVFIQQAGQVLEQNEKLLFLELKDFDHGVFFFYFGYPDLIQHMFWRYIDKEHPLYDEKEIALNGNVIKNCYKKMDDILGKVLAKIDKDTLLIVLSDHGFNTFRKEVHLNRWLKENGYLFLKDNKEVGGDCLVDIDWSKTKAYAVGFNNIYINQLGRQKHGIVKPGEETEKLKKEIVLKLEQFKDGDNFVVHKLYLKDEIYSGPYFKEAADLIVGYYPGYRASEKTGLGAVPDELIKDRTKKWSGDHLFDAGLVPAIIFINQKVVLKDPSVLDIAPTVLEALGLTVPQDMDGKSLF